MICPEELVALIAAMSVAIAKDLSNNQINLMSAALILLGDNLALIAVQRENIENCNNSKKSEDQIEVI